MLILLPYLAAAGVVLRPRFDFRGTGLGHTFRLGLWTVLFVVVNQIAYTVVVRLSTGGTASGDPEGTGYSVYSATFLIMMVPHSVVTVSLATAILPGLSRRATAADLTGLGGLLSGTLRTALVVVVPFAALLPVIAPPLAEVLFGYGAAAPYVENYVPSLALFGPGLVLFTVHYFMLRGFYALERTRTVFVIQCAVAATNIVAAVVLVGATRRPRDVTGPGPGLCLRLPGRLGRLGGRPPESARRDARARRQHLGVLPRTPAPRRGRVDRPGPRRAAAPAGPARRPVPADGPWSTWRCSAASRSWRSSRRRDCSG